MRRCEILKFLEALAPAATCEEWDNVGLLLGSSEGEDSSVLVTLDVTAAAVQAAVKAGARLIVSHHPVIFRPLRTLSADSAVWRAVQAGISVVSLHTNWDKAAGGINDALCAALGLADVTVTPDGLCRVGRLPSPMTTVQLAAHTKNVLGAPVRVCGDKTVSRVAVCGGSGGEYIAAADADAFITGEVRHHEWLAACEAGTVVIEAGHYATEQPGAAALAARLQEAFPDLCVTLFDIGHPYDTV